MPSRFRGSLELFQQMQTISSTASACAPPPRFAIDQAFPIPAAIRDTNKRRNAGIAVECAEVALQQSGPEPRREYLDLAAMWRFIAQESEETNLVWSVTPCSSLTSAESGTAIHSRLTSSASRDRPNAGPEAILVGGGYTVFLDLVGAQSLEHTDLPEIDAYPHGNGPDGSWTAARPAQRAESPHV